MSASNYPNNNDDSFNSFIVTDKTIVEGILGKTFNQNELVPVNQVKFWRENGSSENAPIPIFSYPLKQREITQYQDETNLFYQSQGFEAAIDKIFSMWKDLFTNAQGYPEPCEAVQVVVTPLPNTITLVDANLTPTNPRVSIVLNFRLTWFVPQNSFYA